MEETVAELHCLSRGFAKGANKTDLEGRVSPSWVKETLRQKEYSNFFKLLELSAHNAIPMFVNGDFYALSAPNGRATLVLATSTLRLMKFRPRFLLASHPVGPCMVAVAGSRPENSIPCLRWTEGGFSSWRGRKVISGRPTLLWYSSR